MKTLILTYFKNKSLVSNVEQAIHFINSLEGIEINECAVKILKDYFDGRAESLINKSFVNGFAYQLATIGCNSSSIICTKALAETLNKHNEILEQKKQEKKEIADKELQKRISEMYEIKKGWYIVELSYIHYNLFKGTFKRKYSNWRILAESKIEAYNKAFKLSESEKHFQIDPAEECQIDFVGEWTDFVEEIYNN